MIVPGVSREVSILLYGAAAAWAFLSTGRSSGAKTAVGYIAALGLAREGWQLVKEHETWKDPARMNEWFKTGGRRSAVSGLTP